MFPTLSAPEVADEVRRAIVENRGELVFPLKLAAAVRMFQRMPNISFALMKGLGLFRPAKE